MIINDRIYGKHKITSPVLIELIKSKPVQRLKKISQYGLPDDYYYQRVRKFTRYEHSIGVMILLKQLGASEEEQIAGLLHDVSHTAFSHLIDWVVEKDHHQEESFQDKQHKNFINSSELSSILKKYKYSPKKIFDYKQFTLLEQNLPELCADRVDYSLREFPRAVYQKCIKSLTAKNGKMVFGDKASAYLFGINFLERQRNNWGSFEANARYTILSGVLRNALDKKIIQFEDFWQYDSYIIRKLKKSKDFEILRKLSILENKSLKHFPISKSFAKLKFRRVDPLFVENGKLLRLSKVDNKFKKQLKKAKAQNSRGTKIPII